MSTIWPRVIPCLLVSDGRLVKTERFRERTYIGDPINAVRIFNEKGVDELAVFDIDRSHRGTGPNFDLVAQLSNECFMPLAYGGGIRSVEDVTKLIEMGVEKIVINTTAVERPELIREIAAAVGSQSVVVSMDVDRGTDERYRVCSRGGRKTSRWEPVEFAQVAERMGAGELLVNCIHRDGTMAGFDIPLIRSVADHVGCPVVACGGARDVKDLAAVIRDGHASAAAAGSLFVFKGSRKGVLINVPAYPELRP